MVDILSQSDFTNASNVFTVGGGVILELVFTFVENIVPIILKQFLCFVRPLNIFRQWDHHYIPTSTINLVNRYNDTRPRFKSALFMAYILAEETSIYVAAFNFCWRDRCHYEPVL